MSSLDVGIIGAGRVGAVLGAALELAGHRVVAVSGRSATSRARAAALLPAAELRPANRVPIGVALLLLAVPDDALAGLVAGLAEAEAIQPGQIVAHTSGAHGLDLLAPAVAAGARPLAIHPAMTFAGTLADVDLMRAGISFGVTAPAELAPLAGWLIQELGGTVEWIAPQHRALYHAGLAHGANHLVTLVNEAADLLRDAGVGDPARVLRPLLTTAVDNALRMGDAALTGPVARGDAGTVAAHLAALGAAAPESESAYLAMARRTADRAIAAGILHPTDAARLRAALDARTALDAPAGRTAGGRAAA